MVERYHLSLTGTFNKMCAQVMGVPSTNIRDRTDVLIEQISENYAIVHYEGTNILLGLFFSVVVLSGGLGRHGGRPDAGANCL